MRSGSFSGGNLRPSLSLSRCNNTRSTSLQRRAATSKYTASRLSSCSEAEAQVLSLLSLTTRGKGAKGLDEQQQLLINQAIEYLEDATRTERGKLESPLSHALCSDPMSQPVQSKEVSLSPPFPFRPPRRVSDRPPLPLSMEGDHNHARALLTHLSCHLLVPKSSPLPVSYLSCQGGGSCSHPNLDPPPRFKTRSQRSTHSRSTKKSNSSSPYYPCRALHQRRSRGATGRQRQRVSSTRLGLQTWWISVQRYRHLSCHPSLFIFPSHLSCHHSPLTPHLTCSPVMSLFKVGFLRVEALASTESQPLPNWTPR